MRFKLLAVNIIQAIEFWMFHVEKAGIMKNGPYASLGRALKGVLVSSRTLPTATLSPVLEETFV